jgi:adenosine deaminase
LNLHDFARQIPKAELHVHLEGSIRPATLLELAQRNGVQLPAQDVNGLRKFYHYRDFAHFLEVYITVSNCLRTSQDYALIAYEFGSECARQNIHYAEVTFTIATNMKITGLPWQAILAGLNTGRRKAQREFGVRWGWILDISRNHPETQDQVLEICLDARAQGVVAVGLGGPETDYPPELFVSAFSRARVAGLRRVPHAGEMLGPTSIWTALQDLHADRIGHGVRCIEDPDLVTHLRERQVPLEICPTSNLRLGIYSSYTTHPLRELWDQGLVITVNSDDPPLFGTDLNEEYQVLVDHFGFGADELERVSLNGVRTSFLPKTEKAELEAQFRTEFARLRQELQ